MSSAVKADPVQEAEGRAQPREQLLPGLATVGEGGEPCGSRTLAVLVEQTGCRDL